MKPLRTATVPYANALPLIWGIEKHLQYIEPSRMADMLRRGELDGGLVPIAEVLAHDGYEIVDGCAIASDGEVKSVLMAYEPPIENLKQVAVDPASRTSVLLLKVLLKELHGISPQLQNLSDGAESHAKACLLIGDRALKFLWTQESLPANRRLKILDLAAAWKQLTGLPFVFAVWAFRKGTLDKETAEMLRRAKKEGLAHVEDLVASKPADQRGFWREYFTKNIRYDLSAAEKKAIALFGNYLSKIGERVESRELKFI